MVQKTNNVPDEVYLDKMWTDVQPAIRDNLIELYFKAYNSMDDMESGNVAWDYYSMALIDVYHKLYGEVLPVVIDEDTEPEERTEAPF